jgi:Flp pilus assembly protein TadG
MMGRRFGFGLLRRLGADRRGAAAVEFAIGAPVLLGGLVIMTDLGLAMNARMNLDQAVRAGAEFVMGDITDTDQLEELIASAATGYAGDDPNNVDNQARPAVTALKVCKCPNSSAFVSCADLCTANNTPPYVYYDLGAEAVYDAIFLPDFTLRTKIEVQVR